MTYTVTVKRKTVYGDTVVAIGELDITSYTASGEPVSIPGDFALGMEHLLLGGVSSGGYGVRWDGAKIRAYGSGADAKSPMVEVDAATNVGKVGFIAIGN